MNIRKEQKEKGIGFSKNKLLSRLFSVLAPFVLLALFELALRLFGYGTNMNLFREYQLDDGFMTMNQNVSKKYFMNEADATVGQVDIFRKEKTPDTFRAFVLGASTSIGFPFTANGSFSRWLQYRLMNTFPEKEIEIINLSLTAVNSYTALDFTKQLIKYEPDVVLVYMGHNEYYGALGVGSTSKLGNNIKLVRFLINLRELRIVQLINNINQKINKNDEVSSSGENLMIEMAGDYNISLGSDKYQMGIEQFRSNMDDICRILSNKNIPTVISTIVSNEMSLEPFISDTTNNELSAEYYFDLATENYNKGNFKDAKDQFIEAKDLDMLRFRAPEEINQIIVDLSKKYSSVYLADSKSMFEERSEHGILGNETIMDHLHPYLHGQALISDIFYTTLKENGIISIPEDNEMNFTELLKEMPITAVDSLKGTFTMNLLLKEWPFNKKDLPELDTESSLEARLANQIVYDGNYWFMAMDELSKYYQQNENWADALKVAESSILAFPYDEESYIESYNMSLKENDIKKAAFHLYKAFHLNPDLDKARGLFSLNMDMDDTEKALTYLNYLAENDQKNNAAYSTMKGNLELINTLKTIIKAEPDNIESINALANVYLQLRYKKATIKYLEMALTEDSDNTQSLDLMKQAEVLPDSYY